MMTGTILGMQLMLPVVFVLADGSQVTRDLVVDTGFTGGLSLPPEMVQELDLTFLQDFGATLADGSTVEFPCTRLLSNGMMSRKMSQLTRWEIVRFSARRCWKEIL